MSSRTKSSGTRSIPWSGGNGGLITMPCCRMAVYQQLLRPTASVAMLIDLATSRLGRW